MTQRYITVKSRDEVFITPPMAEQPDNSYPLTPEIASMQKPRPDAWPEHTCIVEAITQDEIDTQNESIIANLRTEYKQKIHNVVGEYVEKNLMRGIPIPKEIEDEYDRLRQEFHDKVAELTGTGQEYKPGKKK